jgi:hypothetical protein
VGTLIGGTGSPETPPPAGAPARPRAARATGRSRFSSIPLYSYYNGKPRGVYTHYYLSSQQSPRLPLARVKSNCQHHARKRGGGGSGLSPAAHAHDDGIVARHVGSRLALERLEVLWPLLADAGEARLELTPSRLDGRRQMHRRLWHGLPNAHEALPPSFGCLRGLGRALECEPGACRLRPRRFRASGRSGLWHCRDGASSMPRRRHVLGDVEEAVLTCAATVRATHGTPELVRVPRAYSSAPPGANCPAPLVRKPRRGLVRVARTYSTYGGHGTYVSA